MLVFDDYLVKWWVPNTDKIQYTADGPHVTWEGIAILWWLQDFRGHEGCSTAWGFDHVFIWHCCHALVWEGEAQKVISSHVHVRTKVSYLHMGVTGI